MSFPFVTSTHYLVFFLPVSPDFFAAVHYDMASCNTLPLQFCTSIINLGVTLSFNGICPAKAKTVMKAKSVTKDKVRPLYEYFKFLTMVRQLCVYKVGAVHSLDNLYDRLTK